MSDSKMFVPGAALDALRLALEAENEKLRDEITSLRARVAELEYAYSKCLAAVAGVQQDGGPS